jgi:beta-phosphoglucomutase
MNKGVLWDMDGVLVDTGDFHYQAWVRTLDIYKIPLSRAEFNNTFGINNRAIVQILLGEKVNKELFKQISDQKEVLLRQLICGMAKPLSRPGRNVSKRTV